MDLAGFRLNQAGFRLERAGLQLYSGWIKWHPGWIKWDSGWIKRDSNKRDPTKILAQSYQNPARNHASRTYRRMLLQCNDGNCPYATIFCGTTLVYLDSLQYFDTTVDYCDTFGKKILG